MEKKMAENVQISLSGKAQQCSGEITGSGSLKFETPVASLCFEMDYKSRDKVILTLSGTQGIKLSASSRLKFSESISKDLFKKNWVGKYAIKLEISKTIAAQFCQEFSKVGQKTTAEISIRF